MARLPPPVTMITCSIPLAMASSTPYWMVGLSTRGSISLGCALVTGRNRVPSPAAGKIALRTRGRVIEDNLSGGDARRYSAWVGRTPGACDRGRPHHPPRRRRGHVFDARDARPDGGNESSLGRAVAPRGPHERRLRGARPPPRARGSGEHGGRHHAGD